jgi:serine protease Do
MGRRFDSAARRALIISLVAVVAGCNSGGTDSHAATDDASPGGSTSPPGPSGDAASSPPATPALPSPAAPPTASNQEAPAGAWPSLAPLIAKVQPSVVNIYSTKLRATYNPLAPLFNIPPQQITKERSLGSGFIFSAAEGLVVTNHHVVAQAAEVNVRLSDRRQLPATVLGSDPEIDLALLRVQTPERLEQVTIGDSDRLQVGDWVLAIGNPFGLSQTVTVGIVSALSRTIGAGPYDDFIQTDASINPGNSGGPLFDMQGHVVGINTAIHREGQGIGFAIPMSMALPLIEQIHTTGRVVRVYLGVIIQDVSPEAARAAGLDRPVGAAVIQVEAGSPAAQAGLQNGDIIVEFNGHAISVSQNLPTQVARTNPGQRVDIVVQRRGGRVTLQTTVAPRPPAPTVPGGMQPWPPQGYPGYPGYPGSPGSPGYPGYPAPAPYGQGVP